MIKKKMEIVELEILFDNVLYPSIQIIHLVSLKRILIPITTYLVA